MCDVYSLALGPLCVCVFMVCVWARCGHPCPVHGAWAQTVFLSSKRRDQVEVLVAPKIPEDLNARLYR